MKRKSMIALGMAAVLTIGTCVPVLAADLTTETNQDIQVEYDMEKAFSVNIPATITKDSSTIGFKASKVVLGDGETLNVSTTAKDIDLLLDGSGAKKLPVTLASDNVSFTNSLAEQTQSIGITFDTSAVDTAGKYSKAVTFTIKVVGKV